MVTNGGELNNEIIQLFVKYLNNQCGDAELEQVLQLIEEGNYKDEWEFVLTEDAAVLVNNPQQFAMSSDEIEALHDRIKQTMAVEHGKTIQLPSRKTYWRKLAAAAVILVTLSAGTFYYFSDRSTAINLANKITPGGNKAILTLANGQKIILTDAKNGELAAHSGVVVTKLSDGQIVYTVKPGEVAAITENSIATPKGGQYQVILPDGTKVFLNAASALTYPSSFHNLQKRQVQLKGEAYFEVAKMMIKGKRMPFIVQTERQEIAVLGTHFNVNNYADEQFSKTTLIEGSVSVKALGTSEVLRPGYQAVVGTDKLSVNEANIEEVLAWKNGYFTFDSEDIQTVMRKISRWYDVDVVYEGKISEDRFGGSVSRFSDVTKVLRKLELTNKVHFRIEERRIIVTK